MSLKKAIEEAFAGVPYPGDGNITKCPYNCSECTRVALYFKGKTQTGHKEEDLRAYHELGVSEFVPFIRLPGKEAEISQFLERVARQWVEPAAKLG